MTDVALLGCGPWGRLILRDLVALGASVHVWSRSEVSRRSAREGGATSVVDALRAVPDVDGVVVATASAHHTEVIDALADRGVPFFVEKPLCTDVDEARRLAIELGDRLFVMDKWRYHNGVRCLAGLVREGALGDLVGTRTTRIGYSHGHPDVDATWILMPHDISIGLEIAGTVDRLVSAAGHVDQDGRVRTADAHFVHVGGEWLTVHISDRSAVERREVEVYGTTGTAVLAGGYADHVVLREGDRVRTVPFTANMPLADELGVFLEHLRGGPPPVSSAVEAARTVELIAATRSALGGR